MTQICDKCGKEFMFGPQNMKAIHDGEYDAVYVECPHCEGKCLTCVFDEKMHDISDRWHNKERQIALARRNKFRRKTVIGLIKELDGIKEEYKKLQEELKPIGEEILGKNNKGDEADGEKHSSDQP